MKRDGPVISPNTDDYQKSTKVKTRKSRGVRRALVKPPQLKNAAQRRKWTFWGSLKRLSHGMPKGNFLSMVVSIISAFACIGAAIFSYNQTQLIRKQLRLDIHPEVNIVLSVLKKDEYLQPVLSIRNISPLKIVSLSADFLIFQFDKTKKGFRDDFGPMSVLVGSQRIENHLMFHKEIGPNDFKQSKIGAVISTDPILKSIFVFVVFTTYYREEDMERFDNKKVFFFENGKIINQEKFMGSPYYETIFPVINKFGPLSEKYRSSFDSVLHYIEAPNEGAETISDNAEKHGETVKRLSPPKNPVMVLSDE